MSEFGIKKAIEKLFNDPRLYTNLTVKKVTQAGDNFNYGKNLTETTNEFEVKSVPANYIKTEMGFLKFGDLEEGDLRFFCSADANIDDDDQVVFNNEEYLIKKISAYWVGGIKVAQIIVINNKLNR